VLRVGGHTLEAEKNILFECAHIFISVKGLDAGLTGFGVELGFGSAVPCKGVVAETDGHLALQLIAIPQALTNGLNNGLIIKVGVGDGHKQAVGDVLVRRIGVDPLFAGSDRNESQSLTSRDQHILQVGGGLFLPAHAVDGAAGILDRLLTLVTEHTHKTPPCILTLIKSPAKSV